MSPYLWLLVWFAGVILSVAAHEAAHVFTALRYGWEYHGFFVRLRYAAVGVNLEDPSGESRGLAVIALAGPIGSLLCAGVFWVLVEVPSVGGVVFGSLLALNLVVAAINLVPSPVTDGGHILTALTGWTMRWRYLLAPWVLAEFATLYLMGGFNV